MIILAISDHQRKKKLECSSRTIIVEKAGQNLLYIYYQTDGKFEDIGIVNLTVEGHRANLACPSFKPYYNISMVEFPSPVKQRAFYRRNQL